MDADADGTTITEFERVRPKPTVVTLALNGTTGGGGGTPSTAEAEPIGTVSLNHLSSSTPGEARGPGYGRRKILFGDCKCGLFANFGGMGMTSAPAPAPARRR